PAPPGVEHTVDLVEIDGRTAIHVEDERKVDPKTPDAYILYALLVFEADPNAEDNNGHTSRHWLCRHESGMRRIVLFNGTSNRTGVPVGADYVTTLDTVSVRPVGAPSCSCRVTGQVLIAPPDVAKDTALYALDAVRARRCPVDREQCTAGCIALESVAARQRRPTPSMQQSMSLSFLFQLLQEKMGSSSPDVNNPAETPREATSLVENELIFNGTPPAPVLDVTHLKDDLGFAVDCPGAIRTNRPLNATVDLRQYDEEEEYTLDRMGAASTVRSVDNDLFSCIISKTKRNSRHKKTALSRSIFTRHRSGQSGAAPAARIGRLFRPTVPPSLLGDPGTEADDSDLPGPPVTSADESRTAVRQSVSDVNPPGSALQQHLLSTGDADSYPSTVNDNRLTPSRSLTAIETLESVGESSPRSAEAEEEEGEEEKSTSFSLGPSVFSFLSVALPFLADVFSPTPSKSADFDGGKGSEGGSGDGDVGGTTPPAVSKELSSIAEASKPEPLLESPICDLPSDSSPVFHVPIDSSDPGRQDSDFTWSRQFPECYAPANVPCCRQRNSRRIAVDRTRDETASPAVHKPSNVIDGSEGVRSMGASSPLCTETRGRPPKHTDAEGFRCSKRGYRVLSLDGGGIRGLILCQALRALERTAGRPIRELYDWIIGTSTGAMLALNIAQGKCIRRNRCLYFQLKDRVFSGKRPYPTDALENLLASEFGSQSLLTDITDIR
ncbi:unnamed protein product, partial [Schistocephalus solidus]|uniref:PNPLA domain-containing protein n=1 Tax=Schistocephalus solidus TaxID=70667 RepID=A0A183T4X3_SCHSO